jgi:hypothetical protein
MHFRNECSWRSIAVLVVTFSLAFAVATRYTDYSSVGTHSSTSVTQPDHEIKRQHIDKSSFTWTFALAVCLNLVQPPAHPPVTLSAAPLLKVFHGDGLYNRPPPLAS